MKRFIFFILILLCVLPGFVNAQTDVSSYRATFTDDTSTRTNTHTIEYDGMVPCGRCLNATTGNPKSSLENLYSCDSDEVYVPCTLCHLFIVFDQIINFTLTRLIPSLALLVIVIAGVTLIVSTGKPELVSKAKKTLLWTAAGFFLAYFSWALVTFIVTSFMDWDINWTNKGIKIQYMCDVTINEKTSD